MGNCFLCSQKLGVFANSGWKWDDRHPLILLCDSCNNLKQTAMSGNASPSLRAECINKIEKYLKNVDSMQKNVVEEFVASTKERIEVDSIKKRSKDLEKEQILKEKRERNERKNSIIISSCESLPGYTIKEHIDFSTRTSVYKDYTQPDDIIFKLINEMKEDVMSTKKGNAIIGIKILYGVKMFKEISMLAPENYITVYGTIVYAEKNE